MTIVPFVSDEFKKIQTDVILLTQKLDKIEQDIYDYKCHLYAFERTYQNRLGDLAEAVLTLRLELGINEAPNSQNHTLSVMQLSDELFNNLKAAFKKAARLCHPDHLPKQYKSIGLDYFDSLHKAYKINDFVMVEHILWLLETGQAFSQTPVVITSQKQLSKRKQILAFLVEQKTEQLEQLKKQEDYDVSNEDNWNLMLYDYQIQLEDELAILRAKKSVHN